MSAKYYIETSYTGRYALAKIEVQKETDKTVTVKGYRDLIGNTWNIRDGGRTRKQGNIFNTLPEAIEKMTKILEARLANTEAKKITILSDMAKLKALKDD